MSKVPKFLYALCLLLIWPQTGCDQSPTKQKDKIIESQPSKIQNQPPINRFVLVPQNMDLAFDSMTGQLCKSWNWQKSDNSTTVKSSDPILQEYAHKYFDGDIQKAIAFNNKKTLLQQPYEKKLDDKSTPTCLAIYDGTVPISQFPEGTTRNNRQTGEVQILKNGNWVTLTPPHQK